MKFGREISILPVDFLLDHQHILISLHYQPVRDDDSSKWATEGLRFEALNGT